jgi:hypothetical protein
MASEQAAPGQNAVDQIVAKWQALAVNMSSTEKRIWERDAKYITGSAEHIENLSRRHSKYIFPGGQTTP